MTEQTDPVAEIMRLVRLVSENRWDLEATLAEIESALRRLVAALERSQGAEADLASMLIRAERAEAHLQSTIAEARTWKAEAAALRKDAERGRLMIERGEWMRDEPIEGDTWLYFRVEVAPGSDLSCVATRKAAIDAALAAKGQG